MTTPTSPSTPTVLQARAKAAFAAGIAAYEQQNLTQAIAHWQAALNDYQSLIDAGHGQFRAEAAHTRGNLATALLAAGQLPQAMERLDATLRDYESLINAGHTQYRADAARTHVNLGSALSVAGQLTQAVKNYEAALWDYEALITAGHTQHLGQAASTRNNLGNALSDSDQLTQAVGHYEVALRNYQSLINAGHTQYRANAAHTRGNLGNALLRAGQLTQAVKNYDAALRVYQSLINAGHTQYRANAALTRNNLGSALSGAGQLIQAVAHYVAALRDYHSLINVGHIQYRADAARTHGNLGSALSGVGQLTEAVEHYDAALRAYQSMINAGHIQYQVDAARTRIDLGIDLSNAGQLRHATAQYVLATRALRELVAGGRWQHTPEWTSVANRYATQAMAWLVDSIKHSKERGKTDQALQIACAELERAYQELESLKPAVTDETRLTALRLTWSTVDAAWQQRATVLPHHPSLKDDLVRVTAQWLNGVADLLQRGRPDFLNDRYDKDIKPCLSAALALLMDCGAASTVANWHLCTQGLRAQRSAMTVGAQSDPELAQLNAWYDQLDQLANSLSGWHQAQNQQHQPHSGDAGQPLRGLRSSAGDANPQATDQAQRTDLDRYTQLKEQADKLELLLISQGRLPPTPKIDLGSLAEAFAKSPQRNTALVLLLPLAPEQVVVACVRPGAGEMGSQPQAPLRYTVHSLATPLHEGHLHDIAHTLTVAAAGGRGAVRGAIGDAADALKEKIAAEVATARAAAPALRQEWLATPLMLAPLLADLRADGVQEVHIVPGGDLHLAPWAASLDEHVPGLRVRQFPTTAGWLRVMTEPAAAQPTRWAALAHDAADTPKPLMWVEPEVQALAQLWGPETTSRPQANAGAPDVPMPPQPAPQLQRLAASDPAWPPHGQDSAPVQALVGIGHGNAPEGNWAQAGLVLGGKGKGKDLTYFTGMDLHRISTARHLVMSCCVLGRVRDWQGEPMGMTALAFAFKARLAVGAMVPVPDFEGAIFSMALHFAWARGEADCLAKGQPMDWSGVFHATRRSVMAGQWPPGFGAWLQTHFLNIVSQCDDAQKNQRTMELDAEPHNGSYLFIQALADGPTAAVMQVAAVTTCLG